MKTNSPAERIALNPKRQNKPILGWRAFKDGQVIDENNSLPLLKWKWQGDKSIIYRSIR